MARYYIVKNATSNDGNSYIKTSTVDWTYDNGSQFSSILGFSYDKNMVVTGGAGGISYQTFNGTSWTPWSTATPSNFPTKTRAAEYSQGGFIFVGDGNGQCHRTVDGYTWTASLCTGSTSNLNRMVASANGGQYAVAIVKNSTTMKYSTDGGVTWSNPTTPINTATYGNIVGIVFSTYGGHFWAITYVSGTQTYYDHVSSTGEVWSQNGTVTGISGATVGTNLEITKSKSNGVAIGYVVGSSAAYIATSNTDLQQWTSITLPIAPAYVSWNGLTFNVFPSSSGSFYISETGTGGSWSSVSTGSSFPVGDYGYINETFVSEIDLTSNASLSTTRLLSRDLDLTSNTSLSLISPIRVSTTSNVSIVDQHCGNFVSSVTSHVSVSKTNNRFWGSPWSMIYAESKWVGVKNGTTTAVTSSDGKTWTSRTLPSSAHWNSITHDGTTFVTVAEDSDKAAYSADGITWTSSTLPTSRKWHSLVAGGTTIVAVSIESDYCAVSTDHGATWTEHAMPQYANWTGVAWNGTRFAAITDSSVAAYSTNGTSWTEVAMPDNIHYNSIVWGLSQFTAVASGPTTLAAKSADGITWTQVTMPSSQDWTSVGLGVGNG